MKTESNSEQKLPGPPSLEDLVARRDLLVSCAREAAEGDEEVEEIFELGLREKPKLVRRVLRRRVNRTAAAMFWREVRATESRISALHWLLIGKAASVAARQREDERENP